MATRFTTVLRLPARRVPACRIRVGHGLAGLLARELARRPLGGRYALVSDPQIARLQAPDIESALQSAGLVVQRFVCPGGEAGKTRDAKADLEDQLLAAGLGRGDALLALGGGAVSDLAGFVAATYHRGIPWIALPTSLLAMVDASLGGKTAVDAPAGKNLIGAFHPPTAVYADLAWLDTLPESGVREGLAEVAKHALIAVSDLTCFVETNAADLVARRPEAIERVVVASVALKVEVVAADPLERGRRAILNFGHTVAHALERVSGYRLSHGDAVGIGLRVEIDLSQRLGFLPAADAQRARSLVTRLGLPTRVPPDIDLDRIVDCATLDKKARGGEIRCVVLRGIGDVAVQGDDWTVAVEASLMRAALAAARAPAGGP
jgi:3-dehydroquinate synthase